MKKYLWFSVMIIIINTIYSDNNKHDSVLIKKMKFSLFEEFTVKTPFERFGEDQALSVKIDNVLIQNPYLDNLATRFLLEEFVEDYEDLISHYYLNDIILFDYELVGKISLDLKGINSSRKMLLKIYVPLDFDKLYKRLERK